MSVTPDLRIFGVLAQRGLDIPKHDPLRYRRLSSLAVRRSLEWMAAGVETYLAGGNASGKTEGFADFFTRCCRGQERMDGRLLVRPGPLWVSEWDRHRPGAPADEREEHWIRLPGLRNREAWRHWVLVQSYDQAKDSSMRAYRRMVGRHPHDISWLAKGLPKRIRIKPDDWPSDDPETWSEVTFISQEGMTDEDVQRVQGARVHSVHADEMPLLSIWEEIVNRADANTPILLGISATPEYAHEWRPIRERFDGCYMRPSGGRVWSQVAVESNRALGLRHLHALWRRNRGVSLFKARWFGEHIDVSGGCPFPDAPMDRLLERAVKGRTETVILREGNEDHADILPARADIERWLPFNPRHRYLITGDPSRGIDDGDHDPCELQVWDWTEPMLVCRFGMKDGRGGYLDEDSLALLADDLGREYGNALIDCEVTGGFGVQFYVRLRMLRYPNLAHDDRTLRPGVVEQSFGWTASPTTNGEIVAALVNGLNGATFQCWSADVVRQWKDVREDASGRPANVSRKARHHREAMICAGRALHWIQTKAAVVVPEKVADSGMHAVLRREFGRRIDFGKGGGKRRLPEVFREELS